MPSTGRSSDFSAAPAAPGAPPEGSTPPRRRSPGRPAIESSAGRLSYRRLDREANRFAHGRLARGIARGGRVMLLLPNLPQMVLAFFGTLKAGAVAVFATPLSEPDELIRQIRDSGARALVTLPDLSEVAARALNESGLEQVIVTRVADYLPMWQAALFRLRRGGRRRPLPPRGFSTLRALMGGRAPERPP